MDPPTESRLYGQKKISPKTSLILIQQEMNMKENRPEQRKNIVRNVLVMNSKLSSIGSLIEATRKYL
jgi:hypothetical protein